MSPKGYSPTYDNHVRVQIVKDGPYLLYGLPAVTQEYIVPDQYGDSHDFKTGKSFEATDNPTCLCRCGKSINKPYCDGTHEHIQWSGEETASRLPYDHEAMEIDGPLVKLMDDEPLCAVSRFCHARTTDVWHLAEHGNQEEHKEKVVDKVLHCVSGRLTVEDAKTGTDFEKPLERSVSLLEDLGMHCSGPLWIRGRIPVLGADGFTYERRNRMTLCRCGCSENKPLCDGTHVEVKWNDDL